ncbi:MAG TPA: copper resistance protein B [Rhodanobacteraceae bacterium]|nr:copper resistance protein B [Rhodanobacteraceae bacterium]
MKARAPVALACMLALSAHAQDAMPGMVMPAQDNAPPAARSPDYSDGYRYGPMTGMDMSDNGTQGMLLIDQLEYARDNHGGDAGFVDGEAWYGKDFDKLWLKFEGRPGDAFRTEALWDHAVAPFRDTQLGVRHDSGAGPDRTWAAFGVQGLAPYRIETEATFYVGANGRTAARVQFEYEAAITQRLILQPKLEMNFYGKDDPQRGIGSGLSDAELGLRLRYEMTRQFAPYVGVAWQQHYGRTADLVRAQGERAGSVQFVAGLRLWF